MLETYLKDLEEVVNIDCGSNTCDGVTRVAEIMKRHYDEIGFHTELVDLGDKAGRGLFATNKPGAEKFDIMFNAHLDTVYPEGTVAQRPFRVEDGTVYGPGCADCKAGVIAIFHALKNARKEDLDRLAIAVCYNPDEEVSSLSSREWLATMARKASAPSSPNRAAPAAPSCAPAKGSLRLGRHLPRRCRPRRQQPAGRPFRHSRRRQVHD